ncbi:MAG: hypothetical protein ABI702_05105 [Burkholderiales bacterium]
MAWIFGLALVLLPLGLLVLRRVWERRRTPPADIDLPVWEADDLGQRSLSPEPSVDQDEETAPAVLSPPEWSVPKSIYNGTDRH